MNYFLFILKSSFEDFRRNKIRTFLTSLGILIGVASVVLLVALGLGLKKYIAQQFESIGSNLLFVMPGNLQGNLAAASGIGGIKFTLKDAQKLGRIPGITASMPMSVQMSRIQGETDTKTYEVVGSTADIFQAMNLDIGSGKPFTKADVNKKSKVVVIGSQVATEIFASADDALGKNLRLDGLTYRVIGIVKKKGGGGIGGPSIDAHLYLPYSALAAYQEDKKFYAIYVSVAEQNNLATVKEEIKKELVKEYDADKFSVADQTEILSIVGSIFNILNSILVAIAAISLIVGGVGIMNIMYVSVIERIREIGIRRAIGATKYDILWQFLAEAVLLSLIGGFLGLTLSFIVVLALQSIFPAYINWQSVVLSLGVSSLIGVVFGVFPARQASQLSPIEAIRYE